MTSRPKIKLNLFPFDNFLELISKIFLVVMWCLAIYTFLKLPETIPIHFNALGKADNYGSKTTLLILPLFATIIYFGLTQLNKHPDIFNYMVKITEENAQKQYTIATRMLRFLKSAILIISSLVILFIYLTIIGFTNGLGFWFLPLSLGLLLIPVAISIRESFKKKIREPEEWNNIK